MIAQEVLEFIERRFKTDCNWKTGNCYYFAIILSERFKNYDPVLYYDTVYGHFICKIDDVLYDWNGVLAFEDEHIEKYVKKWSELREEDPTWGDRIIRDVIL